MNFDQVRTILDVLAHLGHDAVYSIGDALVRIVKLRREEIFVAVAASDAESRA
jgi:hypothetical protein